MTDFFTLNPRYERYELGVYPLEYETVYGVERPKLGSALLNGFLFIVIMTALFKFAIIIIRILLFPINSTFVDGIILIIAGTITVLAFTTEIIRFFYWLKMNKRYNQLVKSGVLLDGTIVNIQAKKQRFFYRDRSGQLREYQRKYDYYIVVTYTFQSPEQHTIVGEQTRIREDLRDKPLPPDGTPIRVLYADDNTHVML